MTLGSTSSLTAEFLKDKKYKVLNGIKGARLFLKMEKKLDLVLASDYLNEIEDEKEFFAFIDPMITKGGMIAFTFNYGTSSIKNEELRVITSEELEKITKILDTLGYVRQGGVDYSTTEADQDDNRPDGGDYAYGFACYRKEEI